MDTPRIEASMLVTRFQSRSSRRARPSVVDINFPFRRPNATIARPHSNAEKPSSQLQCQVLWRVTAKVGFDHGHTEYMAPLLRMLALVGKIGILLFSLMSGSLPEPQQCSG